MLHCRNVAHAHLLHLVRARDLINQLAKKLVSSLTVLSCETCEGKTPETESTTSMTMTVTISYLYGCLYRRLVVKQSWDLSMIAWLSIAVLYSCGKLVI